MIKYIHLRGVAQLARAFVSKTKGRRFDSYHPCMDKAVKEYIDKQDPLKRTLIKKARQLILTTIPNCKEEFNWGVPVYDGGKFYIAVMKTRVHIGFAITGLDAKGVEKLEGTGKTMRHIKIHSLDEFDQQKLTHLIKLVHKKTTPPPDYK